MPASDDRSANRTTTDPEARDDASHAASRETSRAATHDADVRAPLKQEGDALLDGSGSRQGVGPDPSRDAAPHE